MVLISIDSSSLQIQPDGLATADICLKIDAFQFPASNWNDFAVVISGWWASALIRLLKKDSHRELIDFMDGSYAVEVTRDVQENFKFRALQGINRDVEVAATEIHSLSFTIGFIPQAQALLDACEKRNWWSNDAETLKNSLHELSRESIRLLNKTSVINLKE